ncbi:Outer membrane protein assembly factor BamB [Streptomyces sp. RB17]|uniref:serine/threonine-protein kinase n=1 Tax=Streptomyces sp. RB17 TaxID=2585197 RepID=UPI00129534A5|nr:serine/threonine-protein kinase [Streptomyces sp. RB17]MQY36313.1 Outer membrane protein assembly factor BamB [Streptomyces sp. RB17]
MAPQGSTGAGAEAERPEYAGHYRLESCLGAGGMGVVHLARSTSGKKLAVKIIHAAFAQDPEFRGRFRQEVAAARRVSGAFTAPVVDADPEAERPWMATLFIPGPTLSDQVKRNGPMDPAQLRRLMAGLAEALCDIHRVGVVHRDLKPSNVLLAEDGPKVIDFGISRPKDSELRTETGKLIGTPPFMAPEQFRRPREVGPAADIFALGSVLVHAATGRGPFDSDSPYVVAYQVVHDEPDLAGVPESLAPLVLRCLAKQPEERPTADELMRELRSVAASYDTQAFIPAQRTSEDLPEAEARHKGDARQPGKRSAKRLVLAAGALGVALVGALSCVQLLGAADGTSHKGTGPHPKSAAFSTWEAKPVPGDAGTTRCSYGTGRLFCTQPGAVFALSAGDGRLLWRHSAASSPTTRPPTVAAGLVQPDAEGSSRLVALDPASGREVWKRPLPMGTTVRHAGGTALLTGADGVITGVDGATGRTLWRHRIPGGGTPTLDTFPGDPLAYAAAASTGGSSTRVTALDPRTGDVRWEARLEGWLKPFGARSGSIYFLAVDDLYGAKEVVRYSPGSRSTRRVPLPVTLDGAHATVRGEVAYVLASGGSLYAVDMQTRAQLWHLETSVSRGSAPVTDGRQVYVTAADGRLLAIDAHHGTLVGQTRARLGPRSGQVTGTPPDPVIVGARVYATAPDGTVFAVPARNPSDW